MNAEAAAALGVGVMMPVGQAGFQVRLAQSAAEREAAFRLRAQVFRATDEASPRDADRYDLVCDHLLVTPVGAPDRVLGTYRLMRRAHAKATGFYAEQMFDLDALRRLPGELLELGRLCVDPEHRDGRVIELLWRGIAAYVEAHGVAWLFGSVSLPGQDPDALADLLTWLHAEHLAPLEQRPTALPSRRVEMARKPIASLDRTRLRQSLPPLLAAYLRMGGRVGDGAVIDRELATIPVCLVLERARVTRRYVEHYAGRKAA